MARLRSLPEAIEEAFAKSYDELTARVREPASTKADVEPRSCIISSASHALSCGKSSSTVSGVSSSTLCDGPSVDERRNGKSSNGEGGLEEEHGWLVLRKGMRVWVG